MLTFTSAHAHVIYYTNSYLEVHTLTLGWCGYLLTVVARLHAVLNIQSSAKYQAKKLVPTFEMLVSHLVKVQKLLRLYCSDSG